MGHGWYNRFRASGDEREQLVEIRKWFERMIGIEVVVGISKGFSLKGEFGIQGYFGILTANCIEGACQNRARPGITAWESHVIMGFALASWPPRPYICSVLRSHSSLALNVPRTPRISPTIRLSSFYLCTFVHPKPS